jgi:hypothetical protein
MNFKVYTDRTGGVDSYSGQDAECTTDGSILRVKAGDRHILYSPNGWQKVEADEDILSLTYVGVVQDGVPGEPLRVTVVSP